MERQKSNFKPLEIIFELYNGIVTNDVLRFDALIASLLFNKNPVDEYTDSLELPIRKVFINDKWFYDCSHGIIQNMIKQNQFTVKKQIYFKDLNSNGLNIGSGKYCSSIIKYIHSICDEVKFYAYGDLNEIKSLISNLSNIGALRKMGHGLVKNILINELDNSISYCFYDSKNKMLLRDIPFTGKLIDMMNNKNVILKNGRFRFPYFPSYNIGKTMLISANSVIDFEKLNISKVE